MGHLNQRRILLAISGGIAAYKGAELCDYSKTRRHREGHTLEAPPNSSHLTMQALSGESTHTELLDETAEAGMGHIELARWADLMIIAPATADVIARLAQGRADDLLTTAALATPAPVAVAPAMNQQMWAHAATQDNIQQLISRDIELIGPDAGEQACGDVGPGRLLEPDGIIMALNTRYETRLLEGKRVVITAGPTREPSILSAISATIAQGKWAATGICFCCCRREGGANIRPRDARGAGPRDATFRDHC